MSRFTNTDTEEIKKFDNVANIWWDLKGEMGTLHTINPLRTKFITDGLDLAGRKVLMWVVEAVS
jgi:2-polyprenyl-6-hydroxyphenyl methylase/3-demethylubiquinone-9 3-methyltransferase